MSAVEWPTPWGPISDPLVYVLVIMGVVVFVGIVGYALLIRHVLRKVK